MTSVLCASDHEEGARTIWFCFYSRKQDDSPSKFEGEHHLTATEETHLPQHTVYLWNVKIAMCHSPAQRLVSCYRIPPFKVKPRTRVAALWYNHNKSKSTKPHQVLVSLVGGSKLGVCLNDVLHHGNCEM